MFIMGQGVIGRRLVLIVGRIGFCCGGKGWKTKDRRRGGYQREIVREGRDGSRLYNLI